MIVPKAAGDHVQNARGHLPAVVSDGFALGVSGPYSRRRQCLGTTPGPNALTKYSMSSLAVLRSNCIDWLLLGGDCRSAEPNVVMWTSGSPVSDEIVWTKQSTSVL